MLTTTFLISDSAFSLGFFRVSEGAGLSLSCGGLGEAAVKTSVRQVPSWIMAVWRLANCTCPPDMVCLNAPNPLMFTMSDSAYMVTYTQTVCAWTQMRLLRPNQSFKHWQNQQQKNQNGRTTRTLYCRTQQRGPKRFLYEGKSEWGDSLKAFLDTQRNGLTLFHTIAPASQIALVMHNVFTEKKKITIELKYGALYWADVRRAFLFMGKYCRTLTLSFTTTACELQLPTAIAHREEKK